MNMYFVYVLKNAYDQIYIGQTNNLENRFIRHNNGTAGKYTKSKGVFELIYHEICNTRKEAVRREKELKSGKGREWIKKNIIK